MVSDRRGQVFTLEAFVAAMIVLSSVAFALSVTAATPLSASTSNQYVEIQQAALGGGLLGTAHATNVLHPTLLGWDDALGRFHGTSARGHHVTCAFDTAFGDLLESTIEDHGMACNVRVDYLTETGEVRHEHLVFLGEPSANAVRVRTSVVLADDDVLRDATGSPTTTRLVDALTYYAPDAAPADRLYNVVVVEVVLWRA